MEGFKRVVNCMVKEFAISTLILPLLSCPSREREKPMTLDRFCNELLSLFRSSFRKFAECLGVPFEEIAEEIEEETQDCSDEGAFGLVKTSVERGRMKFNSKRASECLEFIKASINVSCEDLLNNPGYEDVFEEELEKRCSDVLTGMRKIGEDCYFGDVGFSECVEGAYCSGNSCPGICKALPGEGEKCGSVNSEYINCAQGFYCEWEYGVGGEVCKRLKGEGEECESSEECSKGLRCDEVCKNLGDVGDKCESDSECKEGLFCPYILKDEHRRECRQKAQKNIGESCEYSKECKEGFCLIFNELEFGEGGKLGKCIKIKFTEAKGDKCGLINNSLVVCSNLNLYCDIEYPETVTSVGTCKEKKKEGERCERYHSHFSIPSLFIFTLPDCEKGLYCDSETKTCKKLPVEGERCADSLCSYQLYCNNETKICEARKSKGGKCEHDSDCKIGLYCDKEERVCKEKKSGGEKCSESYECKNENCMGGVCCSF